MSAPKLVEGSEGSSTLYYWQWPDGRKSIDFERPQDARYWLSKGWAKPLDTSEPKDFLTDAQKDFLERLEMGEKIRWSSETRVITALRSKGVIEPKPEGGGWQIAV